MKTREIAVVSTLTNDDTAFFAAVVQRATLATFYLVEIMLAFCVEFRTAHTIQLSTTHKITWAHILIFQSFPPTRLQYFLSKYYDLLSLPLSPLYNFFGVLPCARKNVLCMGQQTHT